MTNENDLLATVERIGRLARITPRLRAIHQELGELLAQIDDEPAAAPPSLFDHAQQRWLTAAAPPAPVENGRARKQPHARSVIAAGVEINFPESNTQPSVGHEQSRVDAATWEAALPIPIGGPKEYRLDISDDCGPWVLTHRAGGRAFRRLRWTHQGRMRAARDHLPLAEHPGSWHVALVDGDDYRTDKARLTLAEIQDLVNGADR